jgi:hypothetical protein
LDEFAEESYTTTEIAGMVAGVGSMGLSPTRQLIHHGRGVDKSECEPILLVARIERQATLKGDRK